MSRSGRSFAQCRRLDVSSFPTRTAIARNAKLANAPNFRHACPPAASATSSATVKPIAPSKPITGTSIQRILSPVSVLTGSDAPLVVANG